MKLIHNLLGCALVAGLTAHAAPSQNNGTVIDNVLYTPLNLNLRAVFINDHSKVHQAVLTSKDILNLLGYSGKDVLATDYDGFGDDADVVVIENGEVVEDLTSDEIFSIEFNDVIIKQDKEGKNDSYSELEKGILSMDFDFTEEEPTAVIANDEAPPGTEFSFDVSGVYTWSQTGAPVKDEDTQKTTTKLDASKITGDGFDTSLVPDFNPAISGPSPTGDVLFKGGVATGSGNGTLEFGG